MLDVSRDHQVIRHVRDRYKGLRWKRRWFGHTLMPFEDLQCDPSRLRIILGVGRSGTSWLCRILAKSETPTRLFQEPLFNFRPSIDLASGADHLAVDHRTCHGENAPLTLAYQALSARNLPLDETRCSIRLEHEHGDWNAVLVKEVHALLATESLVQHCDGRFLVLTRDPIRVADSILAANGIDDPTEYLKAETDDAMSPAFLKRFPPNILNLNKTLEHESAVWSDPDRFMRIARLFWGIVLVNRYLVDVAKSSRRCCHMTYEAFCRDPHECFRSASDWLGLRFGEQMAQAIDQANRPPETSNPYESVRDARQQLDKPFRILTETEVDYFRSLKPFGQ